MPRTRRHGVKQSKTGCNTCRQRKVKCDEHYPVCLKCAKGGRPCNDWPTQAHGSGSRLSVQTDYRPGRTIPLTPQTAASSSPQTASTLGVSPAPWPLFPRSSPLAQRSLSALSEDDGLLSGARQIILHAYVDDFIDINLALNGVFFKFDYLRESTKCAASALEAAFECVHKTDPSLPAQDTTHVYHLYGKAVSLYNQELSTFDAVRSSTPATCLFLMCFDLMMQRRGHAMLHLKALNHIYGPRLLQYAPHHAAQIGSFLRALDLHKMANSDTATQNEVAPIHIKRVVPPPEDLGALGRYVLEVVHAAHCFMHRCALSSTNGQPIASFVNDQRLHSTAIYQSYATISRLLPHYGQDHQVAHLLRLQNICLSTHVEISNLFETAETSYDKFSQQFEAIVFNAERILSLRQAHQQLVPTNFSLQFGVVQPLYLAAMKYRHRLWRRRAIDCLARAGQEGPWQGQLLAAVARHVTTFEESQSTASSYTQASPANYQSDALAGYQDYLTTHITQGPSSVPGIGRISACRFIEDSSAGNFNWESNNTAFTDSSLSNPQVMFLRRCNETSALPGRVLSCSDHINNIHSEGSIAGVLDPLEWHTWSEKIPL